MQGIEYRERLSMRRAGRLRLSLWLVAVFAILAMPSTANAATHVLDPVLSLTGGCGTSAIDPVPDPSCPAGPLPPAPFSSPTSIATDSYGNIFVASYGQGTPFGAKGRIDIFDSKGAYITEIKDPKGPKNLVVDDEGNLYVFDYGPESDEIVRYEPSPLSNPAAGEVAYEVPVVVIDEELSFVTGIAINRANDHLFVHKASRIEEYGSAGEGNNLIDGMIGEGYLSNPVGKAIALAVDSAHKRIYASSSDVIKVFELEAPHKLLMTIKGTEFAGFMSVAADEGTGHFFVYDGEGTNAIYEFSLKGEYVSTVNSEIEHVIGGQISVDNGEQSPNGALNSFERYLFAPSEPNHSFAFGPAGPGPPVVESISFAGVTETEAELRSTIYPQFLETSYAFEYTTLEAFEAGEFEGATVAGVGSIPAGGTAVEVSTSLEGLLPGTTYVFRVNAENEKGSDEAVGRFATYPSNPLSSCDNDAVRNVFSKLLPDCRAYELVTPPNTNGRTPLGVGHLSSAYFATRQASPDGNAAAFEIEGGSIPGFDATGSYAGDPYVSHRGKEGWSTEYAGPSGEEAPELLPGSNSPDQGYSFWSTTGSGGTASIGGKPTTYLRYPDGHSELIGRGSLGTDPHAQGLLISEDGSHVVFLSGTLNGPAVQLEEDAPIGPRTIYDRTSDPETGEEETHVVSLLPEDKTPSEDAKYEGASLDGKGIAFTIGAKLYLRYNDEETFEIGEGVTFAGVAEGGGRIFYLEGGNLFAFDVASEEALPFSSTGDVTPVNVASAGQVAYFISPSTLTSEPNPNGAQPVSKAENLYRSEEGLISFVGTVTKRDVEGENPGNEVVDGLGLWIDAVGRGKSGNLTPGRFGIDPSRATPDGNVLLFESRANLAGYDPEGHAEIYRYDIADNELDCLSCMPTLEPATGEASLQSVSQEQGDPEPFGSYAFVSNLRANGRRAFFQSTEPLVPRDTDELQDVYEWEAEGVGSCEREGGCLYLISSDHSSRIEYLWAVSDSGDDVFFRSSDLLLGVDTDETPSIYDARVEGGFPEPPPPPACELEVCRGQVNPPPLLPTPATPPSGVPGRSTGVHCGKGRRRVVRNGKARCLKKHHKHRHRKAGTKRKGASK